MSTAVAHSVSDIPQNAYITKRKRSKSRSRSRENAPAASSRRRSNSPPAKVRLDIPKVSDDDPVRRREREMQLALRMAEKELDANGNDKEKKVEKQFDAQAEFAKLVSSKSGGVYMPPARLRALQAEAAHDKASAEYQRLSWDALRKSITGIVNRVNITNIKDVVPELFSENLIRGRGLFARSIMKAQAASLPFTPVFATLVAIVNTKLPQVGELLLARLVSQFRRAFKRNDKIVCNSTTTFIAHLVNQSVAHEIIALQILVLLLERPTDDSIEIAVTFMREVGAYLSENSPKPNASVYERFRAVLNEGTISQRVQYMIEVLMQVRKDKYKDNPIIPEGLDLVEEEEQITHQIALDDELQVQEGLNVFKFDPKFLENEEKYKEIRSEILGEDSDDEEGSEEDSSDEDEAVAEKVDIEDMTSTNLVNLRRTIYLTIMNALNYEEAVHKLLKVQLDEGQEIELIKMVIECCSQERSYSKFYGLIGERFSKLNRVWTDAFEIAFREYYDTIHRYETNRLRNISRFFGHMIASDAISWAVLDVIHMNEDDTTSSSRIFVKIMFGEVVEAMGLKTVAERLKDPEVKRFCTGMFPMDNPKNTRFAINYFTSIGMGVVTEEMREHLKNAPRIIMEQRRAMLEESSSSDTDSDDDSSEDDSDTESSEEDSEPSDDSPPPRSRRLSTPPRHERERNDYRDREQSRAVRERDDSRIPPPRRESRHKERESLTPPVSPLRSGVRDRERGRDKDRHVQRDWSPNGRHRNDSPPLAPPRDTRYDDSLRRPPSRERVLRGERDIDREMDRERIGRYDNRSRSTKDDYSPPPRRLEDSRDRNHLSKDKDAERRRPRSPSEEAPRRRVSLEDEPPKRRAHSPMNDYGRRRRDRSPSEEPPRRRGRSPPDEPPRRRGRSPSEDAPRRSVRDRSFSREKDYDRDRRRR